MINYSIINDAVNGGKLMKKSNLWIKLILIFSICINLIFININLSGRFQLIQQQKEVIVPINLKEKKN